MGQPPGTRVGHLLRQVLQVSARTPAAAHQLLPGALGETEVQAAPVIQEGQEVVGRADRKAAAHVRPLEDLDRFPERPVDETSGVKGDLYPPFCESPGVRFPRATRRRSWFSEAGVVEGRLGFRR